MDQKAQVVSERFARVEMRLSEAEIAKAKTKCGLPWGIFTLFVAG